MSATPRINLRHDQSLNDLNDQRYQDERVKIFAPEWVKEGLEQLSKYIPRGSQFDICDQQGQRSLMTIEELTLKDLVAIARNEPVNASGSIDFDLYEPLIDNRSVIYAIKDLARQCVIIGYDQTTHYGGFRSKRMPQEDQVIVIDLVALQFRRRYNSGRLVLVDDQQPTGLLDHFIFENVVGKPKRPFAECRSDKTGRFLDYGNILFNTLAYKRFVANDFVLVLRAIDHMADGAVNLKFLKYGTGISGGPFVKKLDNLIVDGIVDGLVDYFSYQTSRGLDSKIKSLEFPYYKNDERLAKMCKFSGFKCQFGKSDPLMKTVVTMTTATTNCADPHVVAGNQMQFKSVDAMIAENLKSQAKKLSPVINRLMGEEFIDVNNEFGY